MIVFFVAFLVVVFKSIWNSVPERQPALHTRWEFSHQSCGKQNYNLWLKEVSRNISTISTMILWCHLAKLGNFTEASERGAIDAGDGIASLSAYSCLSIQPFLACVNIMNLLLVKLLVNIIARWVDRNAAKYTGGKVQQLNGNVERVDPCDYFLWPLCGSVNAVQFEIRGLSVAFCYPLKFSCVT